MYMYKCICVIENTKEYLLAYFGKIKCGHVGYDTDRDVCLSAVQV